MSHACKLVHRSLRSKKAVQGRRFSYMYVEAEHSLQQGGSQETFLSRVAGSKQCVLSYSCTLPGRAAILLKAQREGKEKFRGDVDG